MKDAEARVLDLIQEFLGLAELEQAAQALRAECLAKGKHVPAEQPKAAGTAEEEARTEQTTAALFAALEAGQEEAFFHLWDGTFPQAAAHTDPTFQQVEFLVAVYFAVYPIHPQLQEQRAAHDTAASPPPRSPAAAMEAFKGYLETRGAEISKSPQFLPFYALPYVPDPLAHPTFREVFAESWIPTLRARIQRLVAALASMRVPRLVQLLQGTTYVPHEERRMQEGLVHSLRMEVGRLHAEHKGMALKHRALQKDYHTLIAIASELVTTLAAVINGEALKPSYLGSICQKLASFKRDGRGEGYGSSTSSLPPSGVASSVPTSALPGSALGSQAWGSASIGSMGAQEVGGALAQVMAQAPPVKKITVSIDQSLDYAAIRHLLLQPQDTVSTPGQRETSLILQALRILLTGAPSGAARRAILATYISHDLLGLSSSAPGSALHAVLQPAGPEIAAGSPVPEQLARLLNVMASDCMGRDYLLRPQPTSLAVSNEGPDLVQGHAVHPTIRLLDARMRSEREESVLRQSLLGTLQKLSLRRSAQSTMNALLMVPYLYGLLGDAENLSEYTLEYGSALLMNLCLRTWGKRQSAADPVTALKVLTDLVEHDSLQVKTYVNGVLYSLFSEPAIREHAKAIGMLEQLRYQREASQDILVSQIDFVIGKLTEGDGEGDAADEGSASTTARAGAADATREAEVDGDAMSEDGEEEDREDEEEEELLLDETHEEEDLKPLPSEVHGVQLLEARYLVPPAPVAVPDRHPEAVKPGTGAMELLTRPMTPSRVRSITPQPGHVGTSSASIPLSNVAYRKQQQQAAAQAASAKRNVPVTQEEMADFEQAFATRSRLCRTPATLTVPTGRPEEMIPVPGAQTSRSPQPRHDQPASKSKATRALKAPPRKGMESPESLISRAISRLSQRSK